MQNCSISDTGITILVESENTTWIETLDFG